MENFDCRKCGLCCRDLDPYLWVELKEHDNHIPEEITIIDADHDMVAKRFMKRNSNGLCVMLDPIKNKCMIYKYRPQECREFCPGNPVCKRIRKKFNTGIRKREE